MAGLHPTGINGHRPPDAAIQRRAQVKELRSTRPPSGVSRPTARTDGTGSREEIEMRLPMFDSCPRGHAARDEDKLLNAMDLTWWGAMGAGSSRVRPADGRADPDSDKRREWVPPTSEAKEE